MKNIKPIKNTWYDWLINWCMGEKKKLSKPKTENIRKSFILEKSKIKDRIIRYIWALFQAEEETEEKKKLQKLETINKNIMKD